MSTGFWMAFGFGAACGFGAGGLLMYNVAIWIHKAKRAKRSWDRG